MQDFQELMPDEQIFRRVWQRVMPDDTYSSIVVHQPGEDGKPEEKRPAAPETQPEPEQELRELLQMIDEGMSIAAAIVRRQPGAWPLRDSLRQSGAQLRSAWFLHTGRRWEVIGGKLIQNASLEQLLRRQYLWELRFSRKCRDGTGEEIREIVPELEGGSWRRRSMIRRLLAHM